jgi:hypothetical protein
MISLLVILVALLLSLPAVYADPFAARLLPLTAESTTELARAKDAGLMEIAPA